MSTTNTKPIEYSELWTAMRAEYYAAKAESRNPVPVETTEAMYDEMLCVLPPRCYIDNGFLVGEAWNHDDNDKGIYAMFQRINGRFFAQYATVQQARLRQ